MTVPVGLSIAVGLLLGAAGGSFVRAPTLQWRSTGTAGDTLAPWRGKNVDAPSDRPAAGGSEAFLVPDLAGCRNCSDFERGYAWAERSGVASTAECESYSWSYQRGCIAWLRNGRQHMSSPHP